MTQAMPPAPVPLPPVKSRYTSNPIATVTQIMAIVTKTEILFKVDTALEETPVYDARSPSVPAIFEKPVMKSRSDTEAPRMFAVAQGMRNNGARSKMSVAIRVLLSLWTGGGGGGGGGVMVLDICRVPHCVQYLASSGICAPHSWQYFTGTPKTSYASALPQNGQNSAPAGTFFLQKAHVGGSLRRIFATGQPQPMQYLSPG